MSLNGGSIDLEPEGWKEKKPRKRPETQTEIDVKCDGLVVPVCRLERSLFGSEIVAHSAVTGSVSFGLLVSVCMCAGGTSS